MNINPGHISFVLIILVHLVFLISDIFSLLVYKRNLLDLKYDYNEKAL